MEISALPGEISDSSEMVKVSSSSSRDESNIPTSFPLVVTAIF